MPNETYIVLRVTGAGSRSLDPITDPILRGEPISKGLESLASVDIQINTETLDRRDLHDFRRDPQVRGLAPPIPIQLIQPLAEEALAPAASALQTLQMENN